MTVSTVVDHNDYTGNGVTTSFPYTFRIFKKTDLSVSIVDLDENITVLVLDTDYTVTNAGGYNGGNVVLTAPLANGWQISIVRELEPTQETDLRNQGKFFAEVHEDAFDKLTMLIQNVRTMLKLALRKPSSIANWYDALNNYIRNLRDPRDPQDAATKNYVDSLSTANFSRTIRVSDGPITTLPSIELRKNKLVAMNDSGNPIMVIPQSGSASDVMIELAKPTGSTLVGHGSGTVATALNTLPVGVNTYDVFITYGQSNAVGYAQNTPGFPTVIHDKALYFDASSNNIGKIIKAMYNSSGQTSTGHAWASFANEYIRLTGRGVVIVPCAYGGMSIADLSKPATPGTTLYDKMTAAFNQCVTKMSALSLPVGRVYAIWNQGEQDAAANTVASTYRTALNKLIDDMNADFGLSKFVITTLASCYNYTAEYRVDRIQQAQKDVAISRLDTLIISDAQTRFTVNNGLLQAVDNVHYTQRGYNVMGEQCAKSMAAINFDEFAEVEKGLSLYGTLQTSGKRRTKLSHVRVKKSGGSWGVYSENDGTGSYTQQGVDGANLVSDKVQIPFLGAGAPYYSGEFVTVNRAMQQFNMSVIGAPVTIDAPNGIYGREYQVFANLNFTVNSTGGMSVNGGSAAQLAMIQGCVGAVQSGSTVVLTLKGGPCYQYPVATAFGAGSIFATGTSTTTLTINFAGGSNGALVNWPNVPVPLSAVPDGCEFSCVNFIGNSSD